MGDGNQAAGLGTNPAPSSSLPPTPSPLWAFEQPSSRECLPGVRLSVWLFSPLIGVTPTKADLGHS